MIDLKAARKDPERFRAALDRRGAGADFDALLAAAGFHIVAASFELSIYGAYTCIKA